MNMTNFSTRDNDIAHETTRILHDAKFYVLAMPQKQNRHLKGQNCKYRKNSKNWDTLNYYRDCPTNGIVGFYSAILRSKDADRITNRVDTDQTAP